MNLSREQLRSNASPAALAAPPFPPLLDIGELREAGEHPTAMASPPAAPVASSPLLPLSAIRVSASRRSQLLIRRLFSFAKPVDASPTAQALADFFC